MTRHFSQIVISVLLALACALSPTVVVAQQSEAQQTSEETTDEGLYGEYFMSDEHRREIYEQNRKSAGKAVLWTLLFPGLGNIYAQQYLLAGMAIIFMVFAGTFVGYGLSTRQPKIIVLGGITAGIAYGGGAATAIIGVSKYNAELRRGLKVDAGEFREFGVPILTLRF